MTLRGQKVPIGNAVAPNYCYTKDFQEFPGDLLSV